MGWWSSSGAVWVLGVLLVSKPPEEPATPTHCSPVLTAPARCLAQLIVF